MTDLITRLRQLARAEHDDLSVADDAADEIESLREDAARYRWLCDGNGYFMEENQLCGHGNDKTKADAAIDAARKEQQP